MSTMAFRIVRSRVRGLEDVVDDIMADHREAMLAQDIAALVHEVLEATDAALRALDPHLGGLRTDSDDNEIACAHAAGFLLAILIRLTEKVGSLAGAFKRKGHEMPDLTDLKLRHHELVKLRNEFSQKWMLPDARKLEKARREIAAGEFEVLNP